MLYGYNHLIASRLWGKLNLISRYFCTILANSSYFCLFHLLQFVFFPCSCLTRMSVWPALTLKTPSSCTWTSATWATVTTSLSSPLPCPPSATTCATASTTETTKATSRSTRNRVSATCIWARRRHSPQEHITFRSAVCHFTGRRSWLKWRTSTIKTTSQDSWETFWRWGCRSSSINHHRTETGIRCQQLLIQCQAHTFPNGQTSLALDQRFMATFTCSNRENGSPPKRQEGGLRGEGRCHLIAKDDSTYHRYKFSGNNACRWKVSAKRRAYRLNTPLQLCAKHY